MMNFDQIQPYILPTSVVVFFLWRVWTLNKNKALIPIYLKKGAILIDVRNPSEFSQAANPISKNIPVSELPKRTSELDKSTPIILCCASGTKSLMASRILKSKGFKEVLNAGSWTNTFD